MKNILIVLTTILLTSCSTTHVEKGVDIKNEGSYITISTNSEKNNKLFAGLDKRVYITSLNGKSLFRITWDNQYPDIIHVSPGKHEIKVKYLYGNTYSNGCLWLDAKLGNNYIVMTKSDNYAVKYWIQNKKTNEVVGGVCGSE